MPGMVLSGNEETALRLGAALILGALFGLNRELHGKPAGLRDSRPGLPGAAVATMVVLKLGPPMVSIVDQNAIGRVVQGILTASSDFWALE